MDNKTQFRLSSFPQHSAGVSTELPQQMVQPVQVAGPGPSLCLDVCGSWEPLTVTAADIPYIQHACAVPGPMLKNKLPREKRTMQLPKILSPIVSTATSYCSGSKLDVATKSLQHLQSGTCNGQRHSSLVSASGSTPKDSPSIAAVVFPSLAHLSNSKEGSSSSYYEETLKNGLPRCPLTKNTNGFQQKRKQDMVNYHSPPTKTKKVVLQENKNKCQCEKPLSPPLPQLLSKHQNLTVHSPVHNSYTNLPHHTCTAASRSGTVESLSLAPICQKLVTQKNNNLNHEDSSEATEPIRTVNTVLPKKTTKTKQLSGRKIVSSLPSPQSACMTSNKQMAAPLTLMTRGRKLKPVLPSSQYINSAIIAKSLAVWTPANSTSIGSESTSGNPASQNTIHISIPKQESNIPQTPPAAPPVSESAMETPSNATLVVPDPVANIHIHVVHSSTPVKSPLQ